MLLIAFEEKEIFPGCAAIGSLVFITNPLVAAGIFVDEGQNVELAVRMTRCIALGDLEHFIEFRHVGITA